VVVEVLADVAAEFAGYDFAWFAVVTVDTEINLVPGVQDSNFGFLRGRLTFAGLLLKKIGDGNGRLPERVVQSPIELGSVFNSRGVGDF
jgi:hypothetical protein